MKIKIEGIIMATDVALDVSGNIIVKLAVNEDSYSCEGAGTSVDGFGVVGHISLEMSAARYNRMFKGCYGKKTVIVESEELAAFHNVGMPIVDFTFVGVDPVRCPSVAELIEDFKEYNVIEEAIGREAMVNACCTENEARKEFRLSRKHTIEL